MRKINWKRPVETVCGYPLVVVRPGLVRGLPANENAGRKAGKEMKWSYSDSGKAGVSFLPDIRNVKMELGK